MRAFVIILGLFLTPAAFAEATTQEFLTEHRGASDDGRRYLEGFLQGVIAGYRASNVTLKAQDKSPLFCLTTQANKELEDPVRMLKNAAGTDPSLLSSPVGLAMLVNLKRRFPCRAKTTK